MENRRGIDNRANQMNPNNDAYWQSRGWDVRPADWKCRSTKVAQPGGRVARTGQQLKK